MEKYKDDGEALIHKTYVPGDALVSVMNSIMAEGDSNVDTILEPNTRVVQSDDSTKADASAVTFGMEYPESRTDWTAELNGITPGESAENDMIVMFPALKYGNEEAQRAHITYAPPVVPRALTVRVIVEPAPKFVTDVLAIAVGVASQEVEIRNDEESLLTTGMKFPFTVTI